mmetsp:Transcript_20404/g.63415  ORF Transcript_20404/g.63415 Transcript_20404/m.63415 type:complete len:80 (-) Transcript_20404:80-319(-)
MVGTGREDLRGIGKYRPSTTSCEQRSVVVDHSPSRSKKAAFSQSDSSMAAAKIAPSATAWSNPMTAALHVDRILFVAPV